MLCFHRQRADSGCECFFGQPTGRHTYDHRVDKRGASEHWVSLDQRAWHIETVWQAAEGLPAEEVPIELIRARTAADA